MSDTRPLHAREPRFYVVIALAAAGDDWEIRGVLTRESDAHQMVREINADDAFLPGSAAVEHLPMSAVLAELMRRARRSVLPPIVASRIGRKVGG